MLTGWLIGATRPLPKDGGVENVTEFSTGGPRPLGLRQKSKIKVEPTIFLDFEQLFEAGKLAVSGVAAVT